MRPKTYTTNLIALFFIYVYCFPSLLFAGGGPENIAVIVNEDSWASMTIANDYIRLRNIPPTNVIYLSNIPGYEIISVEDFRKKIIVPILLALEQRGLAGQIDYIAYSSDFPYSVDFRGDLPETGIGSLTGLTYLYQLVLTKQQYWNLQANQYVCQPYLGAKDTPWSHVEKALYQQVLLFIRQQKWQSAQGIMEKLLLQHPNSPSLLYNLACCLVQQNNEEKGMLYLENAVAAGWGNFQHALQDTDIQKLRKHPKFPKLLQKMKDTELLYNVDSHGFRNTYSWANFGGLARPSEGTRYMLSTMLGFTSGRGNSLPEVRSYLQKASLCDGTGPKGTFYFMVNEDIRARTRQPFFSSAIAVLQNNGFSAKIESGFLPENKPDVMGIVAGVSTFSWASSRSKIISGAICEHLTSFGGILKQEKSQTPLSEWLRYGAVGSSGTVAEPFAIQAKFPNAFLHVHYSRGCSLAESFYQSVQGPYQLLVVGDPLCQPWAKIPDIVCDLIPDKAYSGKIVIQPSVIGETTLSHYELFVAGHRVATCIPGENFFLETSILPDGRHDIIVVGVKDDVIQTQGRCVTPIYIDNHKLRMEYKIKSKKIWYNDPITIHATLSNAQEIILLHNARPLAKTTGNIANFVISSKSIGIGTTSLYLLGSTSDTQHCIVEIPIEIFPPKPIYAAEDKVIKNKIPGVLLEVSEKQKYTISNTMDWNWLSRNGVQPNMPFAIKGYFDVDTPSVVQFQIHGLGKLECKIEQVVICREKNNQHWQYIPVSLMPGCYYFELRGELSDPKLDIRYGTTGTYSLQENIFFHSRE